MKNQLQWVDDRPVSYTNWNNAFIKGSHPIQLNSLFSFPIYKGASIGTLSFHYPSQFIVKTASEVIQPAAGNSSQCGYLLMISLSSASDLLMGPCQEKTSPGAFLCTLPSNKTLKQEHSDGNVSLLRVHVYKKFGNGTCIPAVIPLHNSESSLSNLLSCPGLFPCQYGQCVHPSLV